MVWQFGAVQRIGPTVVTWEEFCAPLPLTGAYSNEEVGKGIPWCCFLRWGTHERRWVAESVVPAQHLCARSSKSR